MGENGAGNEREGKGDSQRYHDQKKRRGVSISKKERGASVSWRTRGGGTGLRRRKGNFRLLAISREGGVLVHAASLRRTGAFGALNCLLKVEEGGGRD